VASLAGTQGLSTTPAAPSPMRRVGLLYQPRVEASARYAENLAELLAGHGIETVVRSAWDWSSMEPELDTLDCVVTMGGDGTVLRAARQIAAHGVPLIGINFGVLGFLAEMEPEEAVERVPELILDGGHLEERLMLRCGGDADGASIAPMDALNDVFVGRGGVAHAVRLELSVDGIPLTRLVADGVLVASPTGSTAYSLSAGGPIVDPSLEVLVVTPVVPHPSAVRPLVLQGDAVVEIRVRSDQEAVLTVDGQQHLTLGLGDRIEVTRSPHVARFLRYQSPESFYRTLFDRLRR